MRTVLHITAIFSLVLGLASCYSEKMLVDDDVYIVQSNKLPIGESLNDQTSYETFKRQNQSGTTKSAYYQNSQNYLYTNNFWGYNSMYTFGMNLYNPHNPMLFGIGFNNGFGFPYYGMMSPYYNPYFGFGSSWNSFDYGFPYGFGNPYLNGYGYGFGYGYGNYYNGGFLMNQPSGPHVGGNHYSGPRGSLSGYIPNSQRNNPNVLKSSTSVGSGTQASTTFNRPSQQAARNVVQPSVERPTYTPTVSRGVQNHTSSGGASPIRNTGGVIPSNQGTSQPANNQRVVPQQNQQQPQIQRGGGGGSTPIPTRSTGGGTGVRRN
jgi:hypothetical protein